MESRKGIRKTINLILFVLMIGSQSCELFSRINCWDCTKYDSVLRRNMTQQVCGEDTMKDYENNGWICK